MRTPLPLAAAVPVRYTGDVAPKRERPSPVASVLGQTKTVIKKYFTPPDMSKPHPDNLALADFSAPDVAEEWVCRSDAGIGGFSQASFVSGDRLSTFSGVLSTKLPPGRKVARSGYCYLMSPPCVPSIFGETFHNLDGFSGLELEIRGDGRTYMLNIQTDGMQHEDLFQAGIFTRGGPHWQKVRVPFSDFLLTSLGYVQNEQTHLNINMIRSIGIGLADAIDGPFKLDIRGVTAIAMRKEVTDLDV